MARSLGYVAFRGAPAAFLETFTRSLPMPSVSRTLVVDQRHPQAQDGNPGSPDRPLKTINRAAELAEPGDIVLVQPGIYRERVDPRRGGEPGRPITYQAARRGEVFLRGSEPFHGPWSPAPGLSGVLRAPLPAALFGPQAYQGRVDAEVLGDCNPYLRNFNRNKVVRPISDSARDTRIDETSGGAAGVVQGEAEADRERLPTTCGQLFVDGHPLQEVERLRELAEIPGTWLVGPQGDELLVHFPDQEGDPAAHQVELSVRHTVFSPLQRGLGHLTVRDFVIEHGANWFPTWGKNAWAQCGLLSTRSGHHWLIEGCEVRYAKGLGIDCGHEGGKQEGLERRGSMPADENHQKNDWSRVHDHVIRDNFIHDNGHCGIAGIGHYRTRIVGNRIERNNRTGYTSPWWEFAGLKFHFLFDGVIEGNLIRDNDAHGIWLDNNFRGTRVTRNVIVNNLWSGINVELGRGPVLIDNNIIALTRQGDGIYGHDVAEVTIAHNLLYANANFGTWFSYATPRVKPEDGCWQIRVLNNLILGNRAGAVSFPLPWKCAGENVSEGNLFMGAGEYLDEGSKTLAPLFQINNKSHCAQYRGYCGGVEPMLPARVWNLFRARLARARVPKRLWPNPVEWQEHFLCTLRLWQAATGNDRRSKVLRSIRDGLASRMVSWDMKLDASIGEVVCEAVAGVDRDFRGRPLPARPLPGPFQEVAIGQNHITLWPVRGVRTTWVLE